MNRKDGEIEDWEDFETIDEARNEVKRLREENKQLLDRCISLAEGVESLRELLKECQVYVEGMSSVDSELCERVERELSDESQ